MRRAVDGSVVGTFAPDCGGVAPTWACDGVVGSWARDGGVVGSWACDGGVVGSFEPCDDGVRFVLFDVGFEGIFLF